MPGQAGHAPRAEEALAGAAPAVLWLDGAPDPLPPLAGGYRCDLLIVGGGYTGLWAALRAKERDPARHVVILEGDACGSGASGRNGGFCQASLTHGLANGIERFPGEIDRLQRLGRENLAELRQDLDRHGIDCDPEPTGEITFATRAHEVHELRQAHDLALAHGEDVVWLDADRARAEVASPTYLAASWARDGCVMLHPAKLAWGLRDAALSAGVEIFERTPVLGLESDSAGLTARTPAGTVRAQRAVLATNAFPPLVRAIRRYVVPVYDYVLATEPLTSEQRLAIGWRGRQGLTDAGNQFHYYRLSPDDRIVWGGYDAVHHFGGPVREDLYQRPATFTKLAQHFFETFPQLEGLRFTHRWGGAIDTCSRFSVMFGTAQRGRVAYAVGYTGLGVAASRFGARVALDLLDDPSSPLLELELVRRKALPFPPEPLRWLGIELTRRSLARADATGRRNAWLRALDRVGLGYDS